MTLRLGTSIHKLDATEGLHWCCSSHRSGLNVLASGVFNSALPVVLALQNGTEENVSRECYKQNRC